MEEKIVYTKHLKLRLEIREIEYTVPQQIYERSKEKYFDTITEYCIAVGRIYYKEKLREMAVVYEKIADEIRIVTVYPLRSYEKLSKIKTGRWQKNEKKINN